MEIILKHIPKVIYHNINEALETKVTKEEVKKALFMMDEDKASSVSGFLIGLFLKN